MEVSSSAEVPRYFLCPISLEVMRDPVTLPTGITYDRASIERWLFSDNDDGKGHATCPVTRRALAPEEREPTPNHTLRRLIQAWCAAHQVERFPTPRPPLDSRRVAALVDDGRRGGAEEEAAALRQIKAAVAESDRNRRCVEATPGAVEFLASVVSKHTGISAASAKSPRIEADDDLYMMYALDSPTSTSSPAEDALSLLYSLKPSEKRLAQILDTNADFLDTLASVLRRPSYRSRTYGIILLKSMTSAVPPGRLATASTDLIHEAVRVVCDRVSTKAVRAALHVLCRLCPWGRNRVKAVEAGAVAALVELLLDEGGRRVAELAVVAVDHLCGCAEGRADLVAHPAGLAVVAKNAVRMSPAATESAVRALHAVTRHAPTPVVLQEMLAVGVVAKLLLVLQVDTGERTRVRAKEMLKAHARVWKDSPCLQAHLKASYPG